VEGCDVHSCLRTPTALQKPWKDVAFHSPSALCVLLLRGSPLSQEVTFELLQRAAHASLSTCLNADGALVRHFVRGEGDFFEGVRAALIDRSRSPQWKFSSVAEVGSSCH